MSPKTGAIWVYAMDANAEARLVAAWLADKLGVELVVVEDEEAADSATAGTAAAGADRADDAPPATGAAAAHPGGGSVLERAAALAVLLQAQEAGLPPLAVVFPAGSRAGAVAAALSGRLGTGLISHAMDFVTGDETGLEVLVPAFGGLAAISCPEARPILISLAHGASGRMGLAGESEAAPPSRVLRLEPAVNRTTPSAPRLVRRDQAPAGEVSNGLASARIVVAGGAGAATAETWPLVKRLAEALGAALGATRPAVDAGLAREEEMIGQSGARVAPDLYLALGISGDLQHTVGFEGAKTVVAVNRDPKAAIFARADYGVVVSLEEFLPALLEVLDRIG